MAIDPTGADLERSLTDDTGPVVMLDLSRFREDGGRERYARYARALTEVLPRFGGEVVHAGDGRTPLVADPDHQRVTHLSIEALEEAVLQPTSAW